MENDFYAILGVEFGAKEKEVRKAFRLKSLTCHPDKVGTEDSKSAELFQLINLAVDVLTDPEKRKNYDDLHRSEQLRKKRFEEMNRGRQTDKIRLEEREKEAKRTKISHSSELQDKLNIEIIKEETFRKMKARLEMKRQEVAANIATINQFTEARRIIENAPVEECTVKVTWLKNLHLVDEVRIRNTLSKFGKIDTVLMSKTGKRMARVIFKDVHGAFNAVNNGRGDFKISSNCEHEPIAFDCIRTNVSQTDQSFSRSSALNRGDEYESITLQKLQEKEQLKPIRSKHLENM
jgi:DnaJ homolog subfamily C member 17